MAVGGTPQARRWQCSQCGVNVLRRGKGNVKSKLYAVPAVSPEYLADLTNLSDDLSRIMRQHKGQAFNANVRALNRAIRFFAVNDERDNQRAVAEEIDNGCATVEEIAEQVPLPLTHIKTICNQLISADQSRFEWRPIGYNSHAGARVFGIFRKDAPTLIRGHDERESRYAPGLDHQDNVSALSDIADTVKRHELRAFGKATPLPWESPADAQARAKGQRTGLAPGSWKKQGEGLRMAAR